MRLDVPLELESARAWRTYHGGAIIDAMHGVSPATDSHFPEDWIISTVQAINAGREDIVEGLNKIKGTDVTLKEMIEQHPEEMLGVHHVAKWGKTPAVLFKLIDAAERLGVQCHPDKQHALKYFNSPFGKTECWHIVGGRTIDGETPCVYMGFKPGVTQEKWRSVFDRQNIPEMLGMMHRIETHPGDTFLIRGGLPHAIGKGCLLVEVQEPTDYTFRTEKVTAQGLQVKDVQCHYGLGFDKMFDCFDYGGLSEQDTKQLCMIPEKLICETDSLTIHELVGYGQTSCFRLERWIVRGKCEVCKSEEFSGLYVLSGTGNLACCDVSHALKGGSQFFLPSQCESFNLESEKGMTLFRVYSAES